jgi:hypothetical protein
MMSLLLVPDLEDMSLPFVAHSWDWPPLALKAGVKRVENLR